MYHYKRKVLGRWAMLGIIGIATPVTLSGQKPDDSASVVLIDSFLVVVPSRDTAEIQWQIRAAAQARAVAEHARRQAEDLRNSAKARIEAKKQEIGTLKDRLNLAKKEKRDADRARVEAELRAAEREKDMLERRASLRDVEIDLAQKQVESAELHRKALDLEVQLVLQRAERSRTAPGGPSAASLDRVIADLERQTLEARRAHAAKAGDVADREKKVIERLLEIFDAQQKVMTSK